MNAAATAHGKSYLQVTDGMEVNLIPQSRIFRDLLPRAADTPTSAQPLNAKQQEDLIMNGR